MKKRHARRVYTHERRVAALVALEVYGGDVGHTARVLDIPESTLRGWARGEYAPEARADLPCGRLALAEALDRVCRRVLAMIATEGSRHVPQT